MQKLHGSWWNPPLHICTRVAPAKAIPSSELALARPNLALPLDGSTSTAMHGSSSQEWGEGWGRAVGIRESWEGREHSLTALLLQYCMPDASDGDAYHTLAREQVLGLLGRLRGRAVPSFAQLFFHEPMGALWRSGMEASWP